jgi:hypothetical protein
VIGPNLEPVAECLAPIVGVAARTVDGFVEGPCPELVQTGQTHVNARNRAW